MKIDENQDPVKIRKIGMILIVFSSPPLEKTAIAFAFPFTLSNCLVIVNDDDDDEGGDDDDDDDDDDADKRGQK